MLVTVETAGRPACAATPSTRSPRGGLCVKVNNYTDRVYSPTA
jgi:hypothetical protein